MKSFIILAVAMILSTVSFAQQITFDNQVASISTKISYIKDIAHANKAVLGKPEGQKGLYIKNSKEDENPILLYLAKDTISANGQMVTFDELVSMIETKGAEAEKIRAEVKAIKEAEKEAKKQAKAAEKAKIKAEKAAAKEAKKAAKKALKETASK